MGIADIEKRIIFHKARTTDGSFSIRVNGISMMPILLEKEIVKVIVREDVNYCVGDVLLFHYKNEGILIHRLLKIENGRYFCKGDNSFRLEDITANDIIGVAQIAKDWHNNQEFVDASLRIAELFRRCSYNKLITKSQQEYIDYRERYL